MGTISKISGISTNLISKINAIATTSVSTILGQTYPQASVLAGEIIAWGSGTVPTGYLECNGTSLLRADYANLFTAIGTAWGTADGTHFNLPDLRGRFPRGWANGQSNDPDRASRTASNTGGQTGDHVGTVQNHAYLSHNHAVYCEDTEIRTSGSLNTKEPWGGGYYLGYAGGNETRPINGGVIFIIKY